MKHRKPVVGSYRRARQMMGNSADSEQQSTETASVQVSRPHEDALRQDLQALTRGIEKLTYWVENLSSAMSDSSPADRSGDLSEIGNLQLDPRSHQILIAGAAIDLSPGEFRLMHRLVSDYPEVVSFHELRLAYHGHTANSDSNLRVYVRRLRVKLNRGATDWNGRIVNIRSIGYRIVGP